MQGEQSTIEKFEGLLEDALALLQRSTADPSGETAKQWMGYEVQVKDRLRELNEAMSRFDRALAASK